MIDAGPQDDPPWLATSYVPGPSLLDAVGIPAFQFMQDRLEYNSRTHHSNMDTVDRIQRDDLIQMAVVTATFAYNTAMRPEKLPRKTAPAAKQPATENNK